MLSAKPFKLNLNDEIVFTVKHVQTASKETEQLTAC